MTLYKKANKPSDKVFTQIPNSDSFRMVALNPSELTKNTFILNPNEDFSHFEEKSDFKKSLEKMKGSTHPRKKSRKSQFSQEEQKNEISSSPFRQTNPPVLKRCLSYRNNEKISRIAPKRKSAINIDTNENPKEKISTNFKQKNILKNKISVPITTQNNFNITITNINNNIILKDGNPINFKLMPSNSINSKDDNHLLNMNNSEFSKNTLVDEDKLLSPTHNNKAKASYELKKQEKHEIQVGIIGRSLNLLPEKINSRISSLQLIQKQTSIQPKTNNLLKKTTIASIKSKEKEPNFMKELEFDENKWNDYHNVNNF